MRRHFFLIATFFVLGTLNIFSQDFILTEPYSQLDFEAVRTYNDTKITDFRLDPVIREKLMPYYRNAIKEQGVMMEIHVTSSVDNEKKENLLDSTVCEYDKEGRLVSIVVNDRVKSNKTKSSSLFFEYDKKGDLVKIKGDKKTIRTFTRDKNGKITKADNIVYTYKKGALQKVGKIYKEGNYFIDAKKTGQIMDRYEGKYDEYGRAWDVRWHEAGVALLYDTRDRWSMSDGGGEGFSTKIVVDYKDGLITQLQKTDGSYVDESLAQVITTTVYRIYRDGK